MNIESSCNGESTFLKKVRMLALALAGVREPKLFFATGLVAAGTFVLDVGRGVNGLVEPRETMVAGRGARVSFGGVGGLPVEGFSGVVVEGLAFSRGLRNISLGQFLKLAGIDTLGAS